MGYKVQKGDGWYKIAKNTGMDVNELLKLNNATLNTAIHPGQEIKTNVQNNQSGLGKYVQGFTKEKTSQAALDKALSEGYRLDRGKLINSKKDSTKSTSTPSNPFIPAGYQAGAVRHLQEQATQAKPKKESKEEPKKSSSQSTKVTGTANTFIPAGAQAMVSFAKDTERSTQATKNIKQTASNFLRSPVQTVLDTGLYIADQLGAPTNATNYLRDLVVNIPYRTKTALHAGAKTLLNDKSYSENYQDLLANPGLITDATTIRPLTNSNSNFSEKELAAIRDMADNDFHITNSDIKRVSEDGKYGGSGSLISYFTPSKVVQTAIGQSSGNPNNKTITDVFDVNTQSSEAKRDNETYLRKAKENPGFNYETMRATMPYFNSTDIIPDKYKIHTMIKYEK